MPTPEQDIERTDHSRVYRVVLWGPGQMGHVALRAIIDHPGLQLAGLIVHSPEKDGVDAGQLCDRPDTGVLATTDIDTALAVPADVVAYFASGDFRYAEAADDIARALRAGRDVVCTSLIAMCNPAVADAQTRELLESACIEGGVSMFNSGVDPGWINDVIPLAMTGMSSRVDRITMQELLDYSRIDQPEVMMDLLGFGRSRDTPNAIVDDGLMGIAWMPVVYLLAEGLGLTLDEVVPTGEAWFATEAYDVASGRIEVDTQAALRFRVAGKHNGEERIVIEHITRMGDHAAPEWPRHNSPTGGYRITLDGMPTYTVDIAGHVDGDHLEGLPYATVMRVLNAIPAVVAKPAGLLTALDLPVVTGPIRDGRWTGTVR